MKHLNERTHLFPWRDGNHVDLLLDGPAFFPRMLDAIAQARHYVLFEIYLFESGAVATRFIDALTAAAARGVAVKLLLDDFGALNLNSSDRARLHRGGVDLQLYNPLRLRKLLRNLFRDHRKLLVVDGEVAFVSGAGITDDFDTPHNPARNWRDNAVCVRGPVLCDWVELFRRVWERRTKTRLNLPPPQSAPQTDGMLGRVGVNSAVFLQDIRRALHYHVRHAQYRVWIATAYFVPPLNLMRALRQAARRGVDVRLLLPGPYTDHPAVRHAGHRYYGRLLRNQVRVFEFQPRFLHTKAALCDDWVSIGSSNHDRWNLRWNLEANQEVSNPAFAQIVGAVFEDDFRASAEITYEEWRRRPWLARLRENWWGRVDLWLENLGRLRDVPRR
jgi:phosphatidylserine/phosphatidylglycerophosphate/cardiolipin synthase-like enzyme